MIILSDLLKKTMYIYYVFVDSCNKNYCHVKSCRLFRKKRSEKFFLSTFALKCCIAYKKKFIGNKRSLFVHYILVFTCNKYNKDKLKATKATLVHKFKRLKIPQN